MTTTPPSPLPIFVVMVPSASLLVVIVPSALLRPVAAAVASPASPASRPPLPTTLDGRGRGSTEEDEGAQDGSQEEAHKRSITNKPTE